MFNITIFDKFKCITDPVVKADIEEVIRSLARDASVLLSDVGGNTAKHFLNAKGCRWEADNPFSTTTCTIDHFCAWGV